MEGAQVFTCKTGNNLRSILSRNNDAAMFLKVENSKISGKGYICNPDGKNGYSDEFEVGIGKISSIFETEYSGEPALAINTSLDNLYGAKKVQLVFPQLKDMDLAAKLLKKLRADGGYQDEAPKVSAYSPKMSDLAEVQKKEAEKQAEKQAKAQAQQQQAKNEAEKAAAEKAAAEKAAREKVAAQAAALKAVEEARNSEATQQPVMTPLTGDPNPIVEEEEQGLPQQTLVIAGQNQLNPQLNQLNPQLNQQMPIQQEQEQQLAEQAEQAAQANAPKGKMTEKEYNERIDKLNVLKDCGVLGEKEYYTKKFEIVCDYNDLTDFNEKIQKLIVLVDCGLLSEKEFEGNCNDIIKECCNTEVDNPEDYRRNIQKLVCMEAGGILTPEEYDKYKQIMVNDVVFTLKDEPTVFVRKLHRLPVLVDCKMITPDEQSKIMSDLNKMIDVVPGKPLSNMVDRMTKWPLLAQEHIISEAELHKKQVPVIEGCMQKSITGPDDVKQIGEDLIALKDGMWLTAEEFEAKKKTLLAKVDEITDYITRISIYVALPKMGLETAQEYEVQKKNCIDAIFSPYNGMDEFKGRVTNLIDLQKAGMLTEQEFEAHKAKLMSSL